MRDAGRGDGDPRPGEAASRHVLDALAGLPAVDAAPPGRSRTSAAAEGSRAWCSAVVRPERELHLIEATARKAAFIAEAAAELGVGGARARRALRGGRRAARCATPAPASSRARWRRRRWRRSCAFRSAARAGGLVLWSREAAGDELALRGGRAGRRACSSPECPGVLVIGKLAATPERFPRRPGMAAKRPLRAPGSDRPRQ